MTIPVQDRLYKLLPALYRIRDSEPAQGEALRALMAMIEQQFLSLEADVNQLYDDAFIETCQEWLVPYIGDLLGVRPLQGTAENTYSQRAYVANTLAYRQRKGTATVLEQLARDITNWPARAVEYFQRLEWTQYSNHLRPDRWRTPDLRDTNALALLNTPFETAQHSPEVRHIDNGRGRYNISHIGIGLWRLQAYPLEKVQARPVPAALNPAGGLYWINPLGQDLPLFNAPQPETSIISLASEINVPSPLRRRSLYEEVEAIANNQPTHTQYLRPQPVFQIYLEGDPVSPSELLICDLSGEPDAADTNWQRPNLARLIESNPDSRRVAIDPVLGRLAIPQGQPLPESVRVSYAYGFSGDIGGGAYDRRSSVARALSSAATWQVGVSRSDVAVGDEEILTSLADAIAAWNTQPPGTRGAIVLMDNQSYEPGAATITIPEGSELLIFSADWPRVLLSPPDLGEIRSDGQWVPVGRRAHLIGDLSIQGTAPAEAVNAGRLILDGLLIEGSLTIQAGNLEHLRLAHCTLVPDQGGIVGLVAGEDGATNSRLTVEIDHSITGPLSLPQTLRAIAVNDSILDAQGGKAIASPISGQSAPVTTLQRTTVLGSSDVQAFQLASEVIFAGRATAQRRQVGCVRFSYVPPGSQTPRCYRCQPALEVENQLAVAQRQRGSPLSAEEMEGVRSRTQGQIVPSFTARLYGDPAYGQLSHTCPAPIRMGAEDGSEMGAFSFLKQPQREANLRTALGEYLRFGLEAGIFYIT